MKKNKKTYRIGCIVMAAGKSTRYAGNNKLLEKINGKELLLYTLEKICELQNKITEPESGIELDVLVVTCWEEVVSLCRNLSLESLKYNGGPQSETIRNGLKYAEHRNWDGCMFVTGDQPLISVSSMFRLIKSFVSDSQSVHCLCWEGESGNPTVFPSKYFAELQKLSGDHGGKAFVRTNNIKMVHVNASSSWELMDVDTQEEMEVLIHLEKNHNYL